MNIKKGLVVFSSLLAIPLVISFIFHTIIDSVKNPAFSVVKSVEYSQINFDSRSSNPKLSAIKEYSEKILAVNSAIYISFKMIAYSVRSYDNVFQTAHENRGIRLELGCPSKLGMLVGNRTEAAGYIGIKLADVLELNREYAFNISLDKEQNLKVLLDGKIIFEGKDKNIDASVMDIAIGTGFSKTRPFDGKITDFSIRYELLDKVVPVSFIIKLIALNIFLVLLICIFAGSINILGFIRNCTDSFFYDSSKNIIKPNFQANNRIFIKIFFLIALGMTITGIVYYLLTQMFYYFPGGVGGKEVFLYPRNCPQQNDLPSGIFRQWWQLLLVILTGSAFISTAYYLSRNKKIPLGMFLAVVYILAIIMEFIFVLLTPHGFGHLELQTKSINNGIWSSLEIINNIILMRHLSFVDTMRYIFMDLGCNNCGYTIPGTTHPPGLFLVAITIFKLSTHIFYFLHNPALAWAITVTFINTLLIVIIALIAREAFSTRIAKLTAIFLLTVPSVLMHFCALGDIQASLYTAISLLIMVKALKYFRLDVFGRNRIKLFLTGMLAGLFFILCIQMTYGHVIPISALLLTFLILVDKKDYKNLSMFMFGIFIPAIIYFSFEYWISNGTSFWFTRAFRLAKMVGDGLAWRPYPLSQVANFVVLSVMGGILFLPGIFFISGYTFHSLWRLVRGKLYIQNTRTLCRLFLSVSGVLILSYLFFQKTVRLEVERTLHWFLIFIWSMSGIFLVAVDIFYRRIFPDMFIRNRELGIFIFLFLQFIIALALGMAIQDYY